MARLPSSLTDEIIAAAVPKNVLAPVADTMAFDSPRLIAEPIFRCPQG